MGRGKSRKTMAQRKGPTLDRATFTTSRALEYFSERELTLQTGHEPERWPEVIVKELVDNALDACEATDILPEVTVTVAPDTITVQDNGPGLPADVIPSVLDFGAKVSSKDAYISPTRGAQGNALKTVLAIPYVLSGCEAGELTITSHGVNHEIHVAVDRIAQEPTITCDVRPEESVRTGTRVVVRLARLDAADAGDRFLQLLTAYALFNPHASFVLRHDGRIADFARTVDRCSKWRPDEPTSPHWYSVEQFAGLIAAYVAHERRGGPVRTVREFVAEFRGLAGTAKQKAILARVRLAACSLHDLVADGAVDRETARALLEAMRAEARPVKPLALGSLGEAHLRGWLGEHGAKMETVRCKRVQGVDDDSGLPFVVELAFAARTDDGDRQIVTGINFAPTLVDPFRALGAYGIGLNLLLSNLYAHPDDPVTVVVHLACPHLNYTDRGKSSLETI